MKLAPDAKKWTLEIFLFPEGHRKFKVLLPST